MAEREKVIKGLECCIRDNDPMRHYYCPYYMDNDCLNTMLRDALAPLKAQQPRVMDYDELGGTINNAAVWLEFYGSKNLSIAILCDRSEITGAWQIFDYLSGKKHVMLRMSYGESWRCWTNRPTDAEREAAPWANMKGEAK